MKKNSRAILILLVLLAACRAGDTYRKIRVELPVYSPLRPEEFDQVIFSGFLIAQSPEGIDLNQELIEYLSTEFEKRLYFRVVVQPVALLSDDVFRKADFWKSLASGSGRSLYVTGKAELTRETRKSILGRPRQDPDEPADQQDAIVERVLFALSLHLYLIRSDSGAIELEREFRETKAYPNIKQRADFAFYDLAQRIKSKLSRPLLSEERLQDRYLLVK
jgi:hypothetical protein